MAAAAAAAEFPPASFEEIPIIFISSHGAYDLREPPQEFKVPDNVYIFETQTIGDVCLTSIDKPLWNLMNDRVAFLKYFKGEGHPYVAAATSAAGVYDADNEDTEFDTPDAKHSEYKRVFQNMHFYQPGDTIFNRTLKIGGGGHGARRSYANMGFYRFDVGDPVDRYPDGPESKIRALQPLRTELIEDASQETGQIQMIEIVSSVFPDVASGGAIFIFSSCAAIWSEEGANKAAKAVLNRRMKRIEDKQQAQDLALMALTTAGPSGAGADNNAVALPATGRNRLPRSSRKAVVATFAPEVEAEEGERPFFQNHDEGFAERDPRLNGPAEDEAAAFSRVNRAAASRAQARAAAAGKKSVFIMNEDGSYTQIPTTLSAESDSPDLLFSARDIREARKTHGQVYGFDTKKQEFHLLGGGRVTRKAVPRRRQRTHRRRRL